MKVPSTGAFIFAAALVCLAWADEHSSRKCVFTPTSDKFTKGGRQEKVSSTVVCNTESACFPGGPLKILIGQTIDPALNTDLFDVISAGVGESFKKSDTYSHESMYLQQVGTTGYLTFIPTQNCWNGTISGCDDGGGKIDEDQVFTACTPNVLSEGGLDGSYVFVYV